MDMQLLDTVFRIVHVATAITLIGGSIFMAFVLAPAAAQLSDEEHDKLRAALLGRWKKFVHIGVVLFIVSGFYNFARMVPLHKGDPLYHILVGTKILLAFSVFFIAEALVGKSKAFEKMRANRPKWLKILVLLAAIIVCISGFVKVRKFSAPMHFSELSAAEVE
jgi:uncharacterized membrane protein